MLTYGSVCSGIEAATVAWHPLGWRPAFFAEIEAFASAVLAHHYGSNMPGEPLARNGVPNYGDFTLTTAVKGDNAGRESHLVAHTLRGNGFDASEDGTGRGTPIIPVAFDWYASKSQSMPVGQHAPPLRTSMQPAVYTARKVRRLMPVECERLQAFPDGYTNIRFRGRPAADAPRYKGLGNSMSVNVMRWLGMRIDLMERLIHEGLVA